MFYNAESGILGIVEIENKMKDRVVLLDMHRLKSCSNILDKSKYGYLIH
jgi:hypothetical protein